MSDEASSTPQPQKLLDQVRDRLRVKHYSNRIETQYSKWIMCFSCFMTKLATPRTFCHFFATHGLQSGYDIRAVQELLGHTDVATTMIYTHVLNKGGRGVTSPLDAM